LLIATAAFTPSEAATTANCASRDASPATNTPRTFVSESDPVFTVPRAVSSHPSRTARWRVRMLSRREEQRVALERRSVLEHDRAQRSIVVCSRRSARVVRTSI